MKKSFGKCIFICGGVIDSSLDPETSETSESLLVLCKNKTIILPKVPQISKNNTKYLITKVLMMSYTNIKKLLVSDGKSCQIFQNGQWKYHSELLERRYMGGLMITMPNGIYVFGSRCGGETEDIMKSSVFLPNGKNIWQKGPKIPGPGFASGHGVAISPTEIVFTGGARSPFRVLKYNIVTNQWTHLKNLKVGREFHASVFFNGKIFLAGGSSTIRTDANGFTVSRRSNSTEIYCPMTETSKMGGNLNMHRKYFEIGILRDMDGISKMLAIGGGTDESISIKGTSSIEVWDDKEEKWLMSHRELSLPRYSFSLCF